MSQESCVRDELKNGFGLRLWRRPERRIVNVGFFVRYGSAYEDLKTNGISHFIEHALWNPKYMAEPARELFYRLLDSGVQYEACTSKEYTCFILSCLPEDVEEAIYALGLNMQRAEINPAAMDHERGIILQEHTMAFSSSQIIFSEMLENYLWGDRSLGLFVLGRRENIARFSKQDLERCLRRYYQPARSFLVAVGPVAEEVLLRAVERAFGAWRPTPIAVPEPDVVVDPRAVAIPRDSTRSDLLIGFPGVYFASADRTAMELLANVLAVGYKSRLLRALREERALAYLVGSYAVTYGAAGYLAIRCNCSASDVATTYEVISQEVEQIKRQGVEEDELRRAQAAKVMALLEAVEKNRVFLKLLGRRAILEGDFLLEADIDRIQRVSTEDIARVAGEILMPENVAMIGWGVREEDLVQALSRVKTAAAPPTYPSTAAVSV